jgi:hypothetical protein
MTFPTARNVPYENPIPYEWVDARWMWLRESPRHRSVCMSLMGRGASQCSTG